MQESSWQVLDETGSLPVGDATEVSDRHYFVEAAADHAVLQSTCTDELVEFLYCFPWLSEGGVEPVVVIGQLLSFGTGADFVWVDGLDRSEPFLVPLSDVTSPRLLGTVADYVSQNYVVARDIVIRAIERGDVLSTLMVVRATEALQLDCESADQAIDTALEWSNLLLELDVLERRLSVPGSVSA